MRMPAEWEQHAATWLGWPHNETDWPGRHAPIPWVYAEFARKLTPGELVRVIVPSEKHEREAREIFRRAGVNAKRVEYFRHPTNRGWTRDFGPIWVETHLGVAIARFRFTGWAKYPDYQKDDAIPPEAGRRLKARVLPAKSAGRDVVLEGGSIDVNGRGTILTTEECLLDRKVQVRNQGFTRRDYEAIFADCLGASNTLWLGKGIAGDDTHGHVDDLCRFVEARTVVLVRERNGKDENHRRLEENWDRVAGFRLEDGARLNVVELPMPAPIVFDGQRLPASYANFYVGNAAVLVPTFNDPNDRLALGILQELFPDRQVVGVHALELVWGLGTIHCLTQQQPAGRLAKP